MHPCRRAFALLWLAGMPALAQTREPAPTEVGEVRKPAAVPPPQPTVTFDLASGGSFDGEVNDTAGASMSSASVYGRLAVLVPVGRRLFLSFGSSACRRPARSPTGWDATAPTRSS